MRDTNEPSAGTMSHPLAEPLFERVAIIGTGLIGGSIARDIRRLRAARRIVGTDRRGDVVARICEMGLVDEATAELGQAVHCADLVVLCVPVGAVGEVAAAIADRLAPQALVTDVGSVKHPVIERVSPHLDMRRFVPAHPIAGAETSGPEAARDGLFAGRRCILTPDERTAPEAVEHVAALWRALGARVDLMGAAEHDRILAVTSHLPHLLSFAMMNAVDAIEREAGSKVTDYAGGSFADFTRIAAAEPVLWRDVFLSNRAALLAAADRYAAELDAIRQLVREEDATGLLRRIEISRDLHRAAALRQRGA